MENEFSRRNHIFITIYDFHWNCTTKVLYSPDEEGRGKQGRSSLNFSITQESTPSIAADELFVGRVDIIITTS